jgi:hypothetical protein
MVSSEGACAAYYNFGRYSRARERERVLASGEHSNGNGNGHSNVAVAEQDLRPIPVQAR